MRTFIAILVLLAVIIGAIALYLALTIPKEVTPVQFPPSASHRALLARVPASADDFALIPTAAVFHRRLSENPVTRDALEQWSAEQPIPKPWMLGGADLLIWRRGKRTSYAMRIDPFRALLVRTWMSFSSDVRAYWDGTVFIINGGNEPAIQPQTMDELLRLAAGLPRGDIFAVQRTRARGAFPPIGRPAVSSATVSAREIVITSRSAVAQPPLSDPNAGAGATALLKHSQNALLSVSFAEPPRLLGDLQRLLAINVNALAADGGSIALYDVDAGTLIPRPKGVIVIPATEEARAEVQGLARVVDLFGQIHDTGRELLVSLDRTSVALYLKDTFEPAPWPANRWTLRIDAPRMVPLLEKLGDSRGLRFASPRLHRAARDLRQWIGALRNAESIVAAESVEGGVEELRVRIASK